MQYNPGWESGSMKTLVAHGLAGGIVQDRMGGSFGAGFLAGSLGSYLGSSGNARNANELIGNTAREAIVGDTISVVGGDKFANGAQTGAFRYLFNESMHSLKQESGKFFSEELPWIEQERHDGLSTEKVSSINLTVSLPIGKGRRSFDLSVGYKKSTYQQYQNYRFYKVNVDSSNNPINWMSIPTNNTYKVLEGNEFTRRSPVICTSNTSFCLD